MTGAKLWYIALILGLLAFLGGSGDIASAQVTSNAAPLFSIGVNTLDQPEEVSVILQIFFLMTILSLAPAILIMVTSFTRIAIVLSLLRQALGTHQMPPQSNPDRFGPLLNFFHHDAHLAAGQPTSAATLS